MEKTTEIVLANLRKHHDNGNPGFRSGTTDVWIRLYDALVADGYAVRIGDMWFAKGHPYLETYIKAETERLEKERAAFEQRCANELEAGRKRLAARAAEIESNRAALLSNAYSVGDRVRRIGRVGTVVDCMNVAGHSIFPDGTTVYSVKMDDTGAEENYTSEQIEKP